MARRIRRIKEETAYSEVQRTVDRQFLFKPDPVVKNIIGSSVGRAQKQFPVRLFWVDFNINHKQTGVMALSDDPEHLQNVVKFHRLCNSLLAREINRFLLREGPVFSSRNRSTEVVDDRSLEQQLLYAVTNPVKDGLVDRVAHWQGVSSYHQLATGEVDRYTYIDRTKWHRAGGKRCKKPMSAFTETVEVVLSPLPSWEHLPDHKRQSMFRRLVRQEEQEFREQREKEHRSVMGKRKLEKLDFRDRPKTKKYSGPQPLCHASNIEAAREFRKGWNLYLDHYYQMSGHFLEGNFNVEFPKGSIRPPLIQVCM